MKFQYLGQITESVKEGARRIENLLATVER
jgi:hypothetical protein